MPSFCIDVVLTLSIRMDIVWYHFGDCRLRYVLNQMIRKVIVYCKLGILWVLTTNRIDTSIFLDDAFLQVEYMWPG